MRKIEILTAAALLMAALPFPTLAQTGLPGNYGMFTGPTTLPPYGNPGGLQYVTDDANFVSNNLVPRPNKNVVVGGKLFVADTVSLVNGKALQIDSAGPSGLSMYNTAGNQPFTLTLAGGLQITPVSAPGSTLGYDGRIQASKFCFNPGNPSDCVTDWSGAGGGAGSYVLKTGDSMTGALDVSTADVNGKAINAVGTGSGSKGGYFKGESVGIEAESKTNPGAIGVIGAGESQGANLQVWGNIGTGVVGVGGLNDGVGPLGFYEQSYGGLFMGKRGIMATGDGSPGGTFFNLQDAGTIVELALANGDSINASGNIKVAAGKQICLGADCISAWPGGGGGGSFVSKTGDMMTGQLNITDPVGNGLAVTSTGGASFAPSPINGTAMRTITGGGTALYAKSTGNGGTGAGGIALMAEATGIGGGAALLAFGRNNNPGIAVFTDQDSAGTFFNSNAAYGKPSELYLGTSAGHAVYARIGDVAIANDYKLRTDHITVWNTGGSTSDGMHIDGGENIYTGPQPVYFDGPVAIGGVVRSSWPGGGGGSVDVVSSSCTFSNIPTAGWYPCYCPAGYRATGSTSYADPPVMPLITSVVAQGSPIPVPHEHTAFTAGMTGVQWYLNGNEGFSSLVASVACVQ